MTLNSDRFAQMSPTEQSASDLGALHGEMADLEERAAVVLQRLAGINNRLRPETELLREEVERDEGGVSVIGKLPELRRLAAEVRSAIGAINAELDRLEVRVG